MLTRHVRAEARAAQERETPRAWVFGEVPTGIEPVFSSGRPTRIVPREAAGSEATEISRVFPPSPAWRRGSKSGRRASGYADCLIASAARRRACRPIGSRSASRSSSRLAAGFAGRPGLPVFAGLVTVVRTPGRALEQSLTTRRTSSHSATPNTASGRSFAACSYIGTQSPLCSIRQVPKAGVLHLSSFRAESLP